MTSRTHGNYNFGAVAERADARSRRAMASCTELPFDRDHNVLAKAFVKPGRGVGWKSASLSGAEPQGRTLSGKTWTIPEVPQQARSLKRGPPRPP